MLIQFNTDKTINGNQKQKEHFTTFITEELKRYSAHISRVEVHLSDENGKKEGVNDIRCLIEARLIGRQPIAAINQADTIELAVSGSINKLKASVDSIIKRINSHQK